MLVESVGLLVFLPAPYRMRGGVNPAIYITTDRHVQAMASPATREARLQDLEYALEEDIDGLDYVEVTSYRHMRFWFEDDAEDAKEDVKDRLPDLMTVRYETDGQLVAGISPGRLLDALLGGE